VSHKLARPQAGATARPRVPFTATGQTAALSDVLSRNLEKSLHRALAYANERRHEYATLEHLLLALTEDQDALAVLPRTAEVRGSY